MPLKVKITFPEEWDSEKEEFIYRKDQTVTLEHSLVSVSKWETKWHKPFFKNSFNEKDRSPDEILDYVRCMCITNDVDLDVFKHLSEENIKEIIDYINDPMTATTFTDRSQNNKRNNKIITNEEIYYQMIAYGIPFECQKWHINRLITLIKVCQIMNDTKGNKMSKKDIISSNKSLNAIRKAQMHTRG